MVPVVLIAGGLILVAVLVRPYLGLLLLWPVLLCYPHAITEDLLPLNIGFDDLYVSFLFVACLINRMRSGHLRFGRWGLMALFYWVLVLVSNVYGALFAESGVMAVGILKSVIKDSSIVMIALVTLNSIDRPEQVSRVINWFFIGGICVSILATLQYFAPDMVWIFHHHARVHAGAAVSRVTGSTRGPWELGGVLGIIIIMAFTVLILGRGIRNRPTQILCLALSLTAIILTQSRASWMMLGFGVLAAVVGGKRPIHAVLVIGLAFSMVLLFPFLTEAIQHRVEHTTSGGHLDTSSATRIEIWRMLLKELTPSTLILGPGATGAAARYGVTPHNYYLAVAAQYGLPGIIYFCCLTWLLLKGLRDNMREDDDRFRLAVWKGIGAVLLGVAVYSLTADTLNADLVAKALFFLWSLLYLRDYVPMSGAVQALFSYETAYAVNSDYSRAQWSGPRGSMSARA